MERVIVSVSLRGDKRVRDLEVPALLPAAQLADLIARALRWDFGPPDHPMQFLIQADPPGRMLRAAESLAEAGAFDGACLVLVPSPGADAPARPFFFKRDRPAAPEVSPERQAPVAGWRSLDVDLADGNDPALNEGTPSGFVWKRLN